MVRYSFLVRLFHPLLHAGLSRRILDHLIRPHSDFRFWIFDFRLSEPPHLMILSALASTLGGIVTPICFAVLRLITSSNFVGCSTGRSAGLAPLRILST